MFYKIVVIYRTTPVPEPLFYRASVYNFNLKRDSGTDTFL